MEKLHAKKADSAVGNGRYRFIVSNIWISTYEQTAFTVSTTVTQVPVCTKSILINKAQPPHMVHPLSTTVRASNEQPVIMVSDVYAGNVWPVIIWLSPQASSIYLLHYDLKSVPYLSCYWDLADLPT